MTRAALRPAAIFATFAAVVVVAYFTMVMCSCATVGEQAGVTAAVIVERECAAQQNRNVALPLSREERVAAIESTRALCHRLVTEIEKETTTDGK